MSETTTPAAIMAVLNSVAEQYAKEFGYLEVYTSEWRRDTEEHPLNKMLNEPIEQRLYRGLGEVKTAGTVQTRQRFGNPRIGVYGPGKAWFVAIELGQNDGQFREAQIFYPPGPAMFPKVLARVEEALVAAGIIEAFNQVAHE